jgi:broad specificity phosphatase PhoE
MRLRSFRPVLPRAVAWWLLLFTAACQATTTSTIILVRHAERPPGADPDLNAAGQARAESLAVSLARTRVDAILHTQFKRTQQTAAPLAAQKSLTPIVLNASGPEIDHARDVVRRVNAFKGRTVVYVGHSNTVPVVIRELGIAPPPAIGDSEYSHFFIVTRTGNGPASLIRVRFGQ